MDYPNLNMRHHRWLDVVKDYDCEILYHPRKANVAANALNRKAVVAPIRDICLRMIVVTLLLERIREVHVNANKESTRRVSVLWVRWLPLIMILMGCGLFIGGSGFRTGVECIKF